VIKNSYDIHHSLLSFGHSETSFQGGAGGSSLNHINQSTPSLKPRAGQDLLEDQQDSVSVSHVDSARLSSGAAKSSEINQSNSSLKVPVRDITSPNYNNRRHTKGTNYQSTSSVAEAEALAVSLSIPDHSEGMPPDESANLSHFNRDHEGDGYFSQNENDNIMDGNLITEDKLASDAEGSEYKLETGKLTSTKTRYYEKLTFEKKLSAGQLV
jgi:hypothetical protein